MRRPVEATLLPHLRLCQACRGTTRSVVGVDCGCLRGDRLRRVGAGEPGGWPWRESVSAGTAVRTPMSRSSSLASRTISRQARGRVVVHGRGTAPGHLSLGGQLFSNSCVLVTWSAAHLRPEDLAFQQHWSSSHRGLKHGGGLDECRSLRGFPGGLWLSFRNSARAFRRWFGLQADCRVAVGAGGGGMPHGSRGKRGGSK
jgi:hypothetical protein